MGGNFRVSTGVMAIGILILVALSLQEAHGHGDGDDDDDEKLETEVVSLRREISEPCKCTHLIPQSIIAVGKCGDCARCAWNLHTYSYTFKDKDPDLNNNTFLLTLQTMFHHCASDIPYPPTFYDNEECVEHVGMCTAMTSKFFRTQCAKIFPDLPPPPPIVFERSTFHSKLDPYKNSTKKLKRDFQFDGTNLYKMTCPVYYRRDAFTYSMLYEQSYKHYGIQKTKSNAWSESTTIIQIAQQLRARVIQDADDNIQEAYNKFSIPLTRQKFCGFDDVFVCTTAPENDHMHHAI